MGIAQGQLRLILNLADFLSPPLAPVRTVVGSIPDDDGLAAEWTGEYILLLFG